VRFFTKKVLFGTPSNSPEGGELKLAFLCRSSGSTLSNRCFGCRSTGSTCRGIGSTCRGTGSTCRSIGSARRGKERIFMRIHKKISNSPGRLFYFSSLLG